MHNAARFAKRFIFLAFLQIILVSSYAQSTASAEVSSTVKKLVSQIRAGEDAQAFKQLDMPSITKFILGDYIKTAAPQQLTEFASLFEKIFTKIGFPAMRERMKDLSNITYQTPDIKGDEARVGSSIFLNTRTGKSEMKLKYTLVKTNQGWKVKDLAVLTESLLQNIRYDHAQQPLKDGGIEGLLKVMRAKAAGL